MVYMYIQSATIYNEFITFFISNLNSRISPGWSRDLLTKDRGHVNCRKNLLGAPIYGQWTRQWQDKIGILIKNIAQNWHFQTDAD